MEPKVSRAAKFGRHAEFADVCLTGNTGLRCDAGKAGVQADPRHFGVHVTRQPTSSTV